MSVFGRRRPPALIAVLVITAFALPRTALAAPGQADAIPDVSVSIDRTHVTVGDPISLSVVVKHATGVTIQTTSIDDQLGDFEPLGSDPVEDRAVAGGMELRLHYKIAVYRTGAVQLPVLTFDYTLPDGTQAKAGSKAPLDVTVQSVLPVGAQPSDIRPLKAQISLPGPPSTGLFVAAGIALGVVALGALSLFGFLFLRRHRRIALLPAPGYATEARAELDRIMRLGLLQQGELVEHYRLLAACIRRYLTQRYGFPAVAWTTGEMQRQMEARGVARWPARLVAGLLSECDAVTYALYRPAQARLEADNAMAYEILDATDDSAPVVARAG